ncbi:hypothetical protein [Streptomyces sp. MB09-01]|uniref:hypothetical protein n=1 Tax=Streptomyces sp. MB09-01 TaxID=3028666 RepID=UPI0029CA0DBD|nr:hypothetical protein [Streptomyces sp. MB09-01]
MPVIRGSHTPRGPRVARDLTDLARLHGVATHYTTDLGRRVDVSPETLHAVLGALDVDTSTPGGIRDAPAERRQALAGHLLPPCAVVRAGRPPAAPVAPSGSRLRVDTEDGRDTCPEGEADRVPSRAALAVHGFPARTPAKPLGVRLPDTVGDRRPQNLPGTSDEYPDWRLPVAGPEGLPLPLEDLFAHAGPRAVAEVHRDLSTTPAAPHG